MMQMRDWIAGAVGAIIFLLGLLPMFGIFESLNGLPMTVVTWIVAIGGLWLVYAAIVEITNSNIIGWWSFAVALIVIVVGLLPILYAFGVGPKFFEFAWLGRIAYNIIFIVEGLFLMIATFAMEL